MVATSPVLILVFNRPDLTRQLMEAIRPFAPARLFVASDGPRASEAGEDLLVQECRDIVMSEIDWPCEVETFFQPENVGLAQHIPAALDWVFERVDRIVMLEDDCIPHPDFFGYCDQLLERYADDPRVWCILGDNSAKMPTPGPYSYSFSKYALPVWGIAIWKRSWARHDRELLNWEKIRGTSEEKRLWRNRRERSLMASLLDKVKYVDNHSWAYPWMFSVDYRRGVAIVPRVNLISNVGHGRPDATHTRGRSLRSAFPTSGILPLQHPPRVKRNRRGERFVRDGRLFGLKKLSPWYQVKKRLRKTIRRWKP